MVTVSSRSRVLLDAARASAALYVVIHHLAKSRGVGGWLGVLASFGQEAVIVFFLLSGYVIFGNEIHRVSDISSYAWRRIRRIYPALLGACAVAALLGILVPAWPASFSWNSLLGSLAGTADISSLKPGVISAPFMGNEPIWSLGYEMAFYMLFPLAAWLWRRGLSGPIVAGVSCEHLSRSPWFPIIS